MSWVPPSIANSGPTLSRAGRHHHQLAGPRNPAQRAEHHVVRQHACMNRLERGARRRRDEGGAEVKRKEAVACIDWRFEPIESIEFAARIEHALDDELDPFER